MKQYILKALSVMLLAMTALPLLAQDCMNVFFKDGSNLKFYLKNVVEITTSRQDADGVMHSDYDYQHITTLYDKYVYNLNEVDSITFTKFNEKLAEQNLASAMTDALVVAGNCNNVDEAKANIGQIRNKPGVENAWVDDNNLYVKIKDWETITYHFSHEGEVVGTRQNQARQLQLLSELMPRLKAVTKPDGKPLTAIVACQVSKDERLFYQEATNYVSELNRYLNACGIESQNVDPTVNFYADDIFDHDIVFLVTHGSLGPDKRTHALLTSDELGTVKAGIINKETPQFIEDVSAQIVKSFSSKAIEHVDVGHVDEMRNGERTGVYYMAIKEDFFDHITQKRFPSTNSIFFNAACESLKGDGSEPSFSLAQKFVDKGLGLYFGYTRSNAAGPQAGNEFFKAMLQGSSVRSAYESLDKELRENHFQNDIAYLLPYPDNFGGLKDMFLTPVHTNKADHDMVQQQYQQSSCITLEGTTTLLDANMVDVGFKYGLDDANLSENVIAEIVPMTIDSEYGNSLFRATTVPLEVGRTYYYQAYTHDGLYYNYGDMQSFTIEHPAIQLHLSEIAIEAGTTADVVILQGSGNYTVKSDNSDVAEATVDIDHVHIISYAVGNAVITVTDVLSGKTATIQVKVTKPAEVPANAVDLGLPSGTLWASYNVGARKPEEYGDYYAWGEIDTKDSYTWSNYIHCDGTKETIHDIGTDISGTDYDVAHMLWGGRWTMPTLSQITELINRCTFESTILNGVAGFRVIGPNGNSIFLPSAGYGVGDMIYSIGEICRYNSGALFASNNAENYTLFRYNDSFRRFGAWRYYGHPVRPVTTPEPVVVENADQPLDLGLTSGTLWAQCNLGASQPHESGNYYAWGETKPKEKYDKASYSLYNSSTDTYTDIGTNISGTEYDAAHVTLGGTWHMPTYAEFTELKDECEWKYTVMNGVNGYRVTGPNGNSIFIPCADDKEDESVYPAPPSDTDGFYWSSMRMSDARYSLSLHFNENGAYWPHGYLNFMGFSIRPVMTK